MKFIIIQHLLGTHRLLGVKDHDSGGKTDPSS